MDFIVYYCKADIICYSSGERLVFFRQLFFNSSNIPVQVKVWLAAVTAFLFMIYWQDQWVAPGLLGYLLQFLEN